MMMIMRKTMMVIISDNDDNKRCNDNGCNDNSNKPKLKIGIMITTITASIRIIML